MSVAVPPPLSLVASTWYSTVKRMPPERPPATPFHTREWAAAWQSVHTEPVLTHRHLYLQPRTGPAAPGYRLSFSLVDGSPLWQSMARSAGARPAFAGPVLYGPSVYGEYGGLPGAPTEVMAEAVDRGRRLAADLGTNALVIANLTRSELAQWQTARPSDAQVTLYWAHQALVGHGIDDFLSAATSKHRGEARRQLRLGEEAGLRLHIAHGPELRPYLDQFTHQARTTSERHGQALYGRDMLERLTTVPGATGVLALTGDGELAGGFYCFRAGSTLYLWAAAIDPARRASHHTYGWLMLQSVAYAAQTGASIVDAGRANYTYKRRLGFRAEPLTSLVYLTSPSPQLVSRLRALDTALGEHTRQAWSRTGSGQFAA